MAQKCVHKGCGKKFTDPEEECVYHPGPPVFHEGQKGWNCCKPRFLTFDEFLSIPPCTTGKHSTVDETPNPTSTVAANDAIPLRAPKAVPTTESPARAAQPAAPPPPPDPEPESDSDDPSIPITPNTTCRRRGCGASSSSSTASLREGEKCVYHPGRPIFHEGSKGWTCCKRRVLEFDEFMRIEGCEEKPRHMFVGSGKKDAKNANEKLIETVRSDFYQTVTTVHASLYLKKIVKPDASVTFSSPTKVDVDLPTSDNMRYKTSIPLFGPIDTEKSSYKIMSTKMELTLAKADSQGWPVLRADDQRTGEIIQAGKVVPS